MPCWIHAYVYILYINRLQVTEMNKTNKAEGNRFARVSTQTNGANVESSYATGNVVCIIYSSSKVHVI